MSTAVLQSRGIAGRPAAALGRLAAAALLTLMLIAAQAYADVGARIIDRCTHGESLSGFTQQDYTRALQELPTEVEEYSDCASLIHRAQLAAAAARAGGSAAGSAVAAPSAIPLTPAQRTALKSVSKTGGTPQRVGNQLIRPGVVHASVASAFSSLPSALLAVLALVLACALVLAGGSIRNRVRARRSS